MDFDKDHILGVVLLNTPESSFKEDFCSQVINSDQALFFKF